MSVRLINPDTLTKPVGYSHAAIGSGDVLELAGQVGWDREEKFADGLVAQVAQALDNLVAVLDACGRGAEDLARLRIYTVDVAGYRDNLKEIGGVYRERFGKHFPAMTLVGVAALFDPGALVEIEGVAYVD